VRADLARNGPPCTTAATSAGRSRWSPG